MRTGIIYIHSCIRIRTYILIYMVFIIECGGIGVEEMDAKLCINS